MNVIAQGVRSEWKRGRGERIKERKPLRSIHIGPNEAHILPEHHEPSSQRHHHALRASYGKHLIQRVCSMDVFGVKLPDTDMCTHPVRALIPNHYIHCITSKATMAARSTQYTNFGCVICSMWPKTKPSITARLFIVLDLAWTTCNKPFGNHLLITASTKVYTTKPELSTVLV